MNRANTFGSLILIALCTMIVHAQTQRKPSVALVAPNGVSVSTLHPSQYGRPTLFPVLTPKGVAVTRNWPLQEARAGARKDHPHHKSIWFAHGDVNGHDFWSEHKGAGRIVAIDAATGSRDATHEIISRCKWVSGDGKTICTDKRTITVANDGKTNVIDFTVELIASHGSITLGDTKEGTMAIRLHPALRVKGEIATGHALNSEGHTDGSAWGKRARWVHYFGTINRAAISVSLLDHPSNLRHPCWWHARTYGLVAANPFGVHHFTGMKQGAGNLRIPLGESRTFRYRFLISDGHMPKGQLETHWEAFSKTPHSSNPTPGERMARSLKGWRSQMQREARQRGITSSRDAQRTHVATSLGLAPFPMRTPLDLQVHGEASDGDVIVRRVSFRTWPGHRAGAWMWTHRERSTSPGAAVLCPHGHWSDGALHDVVRARATHLALMGARVLVVDNAHVENIAAGVSSIGAMTWNNIRALDLLLSFADVDPARVGITGASGGAQQTMYMMALDNRLRAAAPICMITRFSEILDENSSHCGCNHPPSMGYLGDEPLFCALFAPRPVFYGSVTGDWTARFPEQGLKDIRSIYESYGALNAISHTHRDAGHNYDQLFRSAVYRFFKETLGLSGTDNETQDPDVSREVCKSLGGPKKRSPHQKTLAGEFLSRRPALIHRHQLAPALSWNPSRSPLTIPEQAPASGDFDRREFRGEGGAPITLLLKQGATKEPGPWVLAVSALPLADLPRGLSAALLQFKKLAIMTPRFSGDAGRLQKHWERNGLLLGCGVGYIAAHDIAGAAASLPGNDRVRLVTMGDEGPAGLIAATMAKRIEDVVVPTYGKSYRQDGNRRPQLPEILRLGGMEAIIGRIPPPCRLLIGGAPKDAPWRSESRRNLLTQDAALPPEAVTRALKQ